MTEPSKCRKLWTEEETAELGLLCAESRDWKAIGSSLGRTPEACRIKAVMSGFVIPKPRPKSLGTTRLYSGCVLS
jgi:hypothetical protein